MSYAHKLQYAGNDPYKPEKHRAKSDDDDLTYREYEQLRDDDVYRKLAELRWLASEAESELHAVDLVEESNAGDALFAAIATTDAPLQQAVDRYVAQWLAEHRVDDVDADDREVSADV
ncbi:hypothetical protein [Halobellus rubicundus]|uniref:Uncharacterized protein n=1 Tax=Halobellus rubicundus TaxID=2996466 RepID=A0ABD5MJ87_9EURY